MKLEYVLHIIKQSPLFSLCTLKITFFSNCEHDCTLFKIYDFHRKDIVFKTFYLNLSISVS